MYKAETYIHYSYTMPSDLRCYGFLPHISRERRIIILNTSSKEGFVLHPLQGALKYTP
jgi:hypothetical protein